MTRTRNRFFVAAAVLFAAAALSSPAPAADGAEPPLVTIGGAEKPPVIDGKIADGEWDRAAATCAFRQVAGGDAARRSTLCLLSFDERNFYLAFRCHAPSPPRATVKNADGPLWDDDAVEVFVRPDPASGDYFQFIGNSIGVKWDSKGKDPKWNGEWTYAASVAPGKWEAELAIPFSSIGTSAPKDGGAFGLNVARDAQAGGREISSWAWTNGTLHVPERFGKALFDRNGAAVRLMEIGNLADGKVRPALRICAPASRGSDVVAGVEVVSGKDVLFRKKDDRSIPAGGAADVSYEFDVDRPGSYELRIDVGKKGGGAVCQTTLPFTIREPLTAKMIQMQLKGQIALDMDASGAKVPPERLTATAEIQSKDGATYRQVSTGFDRKAHAMALLDISDIGAGEHNVVMRLYDDKAKGLGSATMKLTKPERPEWLGSSAGVTDAVIPPWTPLKVSAGAVQCWGRTYEFLAHPWPIKIVTQDNSILAGPIRLNGKIGREDIAWRTDKAAFTETSDAAAVLESRLESDRLVLSAQTRIEYDGLIRMDMTLTPKGETTIDALSLDIPLKKEWATLYHFWPGRWRSTYNSGAVPAEGMKIPFKPFVWVGREEGGLSWFTESDEQWSHKNRDEAIEIVPGADSVVLRAHLVAEPITIERPRQYTIGLQATPVKPIPADWREWRICHGASYGMDERIVHASNTLTYPAKGNIRTDRGTLETWVRVDFDPNEPIKDMSSRGVLNQSFFVLNLTGDRQFGFYWNIDDRGMRVYAKVGSTYPLVMGARADWKKGEFHHIAFTWGDEMRIYFDGKLAESRKYKGLVDGNLDNAVLTFGANRSDFLIDELRISDMPRDSFDLTNAPAADEHTLLLDHFEGKVEPGSDRLPPAAKIAADVKGDCGMVTGKLALAPARFGTGLPLHDAGPPVNALDRAAELGVKTLVFHEHWTEIQNYTETNHKEELKKLVAECHKRGIKLLLYFGYEISNIAPEWPFYSEECLIKLPGAPVNPNGGYHRSPEQRAYTVCYNSPWQNFLADGIQHVLETYDIDGVYLDGTIEPFGCLNYLHGCSYLDKSGERQPTYPIFAVRNLMKRIYNLCTVRRKGLVSAHQSTCCVTPTLAFTSSYWDGEQLGSLPAADDPASVIPLEAFRAEFMGRNFGLPCEFLVYPPHPYTIDEALSFTMLHDVPVRPGGVGRALEDISRIWNVWTEFGAAQAQWLPYWRNAGYVTASPDGVKASVYSRGAQGALLVVSNLGKDAVDADVRLNIKALELPEKLSAKDAITKEPMPLEGGVLRLHLPRLRMKMIRVEGVK